MTEKTTDEVFLHPGEWYFGGPDTVIRTLLGSCVSITLWHPKLLVGGMCHFLLSHRKGPASDCFSGRYAEEAMLLLLHEVLATGRPLREFHAKLIGGSTVLMVIERSLPEHDVPARNIEAARRLAHQLSLKVQAEDLGGTSARVVKFYVRTGDVWIRQVQVADINVDPDAGRQTK
jgi:chemotaxis protein CheD